MKICLISNQIASWGKIGGFGTATRAIGSGIAEKGIEVSAVVPIRANKGQKQFEVLDGISVHGVSNWKTIISGEIFKHINADIYHSQEPTIASYHAIKAVPEAIHIITCRDPRSFTDHLIELKHSNLSRKLLSPINTWLYEASPWVKQAVKKAKLVFVPAPECLNNKVKQLYGNSINPNFVPSPVDLPINEVQKSKEPTIIFVGRWDRRKKIEKFFELARNNPQLKFVAIGNSHDDKYDKYLRNNFRNIKNLEMPGFVPRFGKPGINDYYEKAWIIVNTSAREGLPYTFIESLAYECAILSCVNPDDFARRFGYHVKEDDFQEGLDWLLEKGRWRKLGKGGADYVRGIFSKENSINEHMNYYTGMLKNNM